DLRMRLSFSLRHSSNIAFCTLSLHDALPIYLDVVEWFDHGVHAHVDEEQAVRRGRRDAGLALKRGDLLRAEIVRDVRVALQGKRSEEHTSELQSRSDLVCRLLLEKKN